jgi:hypothetical protein
MWETVGMQSCVSPDALVAVAALHALSLVLFAFYSSPARRRMPTAEPTAGTTSGADSADAEVAALETALAHARQRAAAAATAARAAAHAPTPAEAKATAQADADAEMAADAETMAEYEAGEYEVEAIISTTRACDDRSACGGKAHTKPDCKCERKYLVKWKDYNAEGDNTWETEEQLTRNANDILTAFKLVHKVPPYHPPSRSSSRSSSNASQTAAAAAAATAAAAAAAKQANGALRPDVAAPVLPPKVSTPRPDATLNGHTDGQCQVWDMPAFGRCGAHGAAVLDGDSLTSVKRAYAVYSRTAAELKRCPARYAADIASEDGGDAKTAVERRVAALRAQNTTHHMTLTDISANGALCAYRIAVVAINSALDRGADTHTTYHGHERADRTGVLILVGRHYRVLLPRDRAAGNTFTRDTIDHALEFARAHALAWHLEKTTAPPYPDEPANPPTSTADAAKHTAHGSAPKPKPTKPAEAGAPGGAEWKTQHTMQCVKAINAARAIIIDAGPGVIDINAIAHRLAVAGVTLSAFARKWTIASDKSVHVEALSPEMHTALLSFAPAVRVATRTTGLINLTPARQRPTPTAPTPPEPKAQDTRGKPRGRGGWRAGHGRGHPLAGGAAPNHGNGRGGSSAADPMAWMMRRQEEQYEQQQQVQQQLQQLTQLVRQQQHQPESQKPAVYVPRPLPVPLPLPPPHSAIPAPRAQANTRSSVAAEFAQYQEFMALKALKDTEQPAATGVAAAHDRMHHHNGHGGGDDGYAHDQSAYNTTR